jgi:hypothetical protein
MVAAARPALVHQLAAIASPKPATAIGLCRLPRSHRRCRAWTTSGLGPNFTEDNEMRITDAAVLVRDGKVLISDGPFAETKEQIGGYCLIDCKDLDEAIESSAL